MVARPLCHRGLRLLDLSVIGPLRSLDLSVGGSVGRTVLGRCQVKEEGLLQTNSVQLGAGTKVGTSQRSKGVIKVYVVFFFRAP